MNTTISGSAVGRTHRRPKTYAPGRTCKDQACTVRLSRYNKADHCFSHSPAQFPRLRGEFTEEFLERNPA